MAKSNSAPPASPMFLLLLLFFFYIYVFVLFSLPSVLNLVAMPFWHIVNSDVETLDLEDAGDGGYALTGAQPDLWISTSTWSF